LPLLYRDSSTELSLTFYRQIADTVLDVGEDFGLEPNAGKTKLIFQSSLVRLFQNIALE
jgi:hypothetical protein